MNTLKDLFLLDPQVIYLNHGSFGACPRPVFETYQTWQQQLERQPVEFLGRRAVDLFAQARCELASYLNVEAENIVFFPNPTTAINMVARSLDLNPGDEILATNHEYGAMDRTWRFIARRSGASYVQIPINLPVTEPQEVIERFWSGVNERTRLIFISHITSPTALIFPIQEICRRARQAGLLTIIDGAHAPGQIAVDLAALEADLYTGACHKWMMAPKGGAFLYAQPAVQHWLAPLVVSWGYESDHPSGSKFIDYHEWQGTRDLAAFLSVPAAIDFQRQYAWESVREACYNLAISAQRQLSSRLGLQPVCPPAGLPSTADHTWYRQMFAMRLPSETDLDILKTRLYEDFKIEVPTIAWNGEKLIRISIQGYNSQEDIDCLVDALSKLL